MDTNDEALCKASIDSRRVLRRSRRSLWLCAARAYPCGAGIVFTWIATCSARGSVFAWVLPLLCGFLFSECAMQKTGVVVEAVKIAPAVSVTAITFLGCQISDWVSIVTLTYTLTLLGHFIWKKLVRPWWRKRRLQTGV